MSRQHSSHDYFMQNPSAFGEGSWCFQTQGTSVNARQEEIVFRHDTVLCGQDSVVATPQCDGLTSLFERW